jgi:hypothetical protein
MVVVRGVYAWLYPRSEGPPHPTTALSPLVKLIGRRVWDKRLVPIKAVLESSLVVAIADAYDSRMDSIGRGEVMGSA